MILTKKEKINKNPKPKTDKNSIQNYSDREIFEIFNLEVMNIIYKIHYEKGNLNHFEEWKSVLWIGRHLNNTDEGFKLFLKYSRMVKGYENENENIIKAHFYQKNQYDKNFNELP